MLSGTAQSNDVCVGIATGHPSTKQDAGHLVSA